KLLDDTPFGKYYGLSNNKIYIDFRTIPENAFNEKRTAYLNVQRIDLHREIERLDKQYQRKNK
ncbi:hypothetical protein, partial [Chitinophaga sp.]|uniref:hypothetical protein n=1 Tax=Chitinophaga sp. TaxID=1869181 RepID=UPI002B7850D1